MTSRTRFTRIDQKKALVLVDADQDLAASGRVYAVVTERAAAAGLCRHHSGAVIFANIACSPLPLAQARKTFGTLPWGGTRRFLSEAEAIEHLIRLLHAGKANAWLKTAAKLPESVAPLLHHPRVRAVLMAELAFCASASVSTSNSRH